MKFKTNNYWWTSRKIQKKPRGRKWYWLVIKLALLLLRLICKLIDIFGGVNDEH